MYCRCMFELCMLSVMVCFDFVYLSLGKPLGIILFSVHVSICTNFIAVGVAIRKLQCFVLDNP